MTSHPSPDGISDARFAELQRRADALVAAHDAYNVNQGGDVLARLSEAEGDFSDYVTDHVRDVAALCTLVRGASEDRARLAEPKPLPANTRFHVGHVIALGMLIGIAAEAEPTGDDLADRNVRNAIARAHEVHDYLHKVFGSIDAARTPNQDSPNGR